MRNGYTVTYQMRKRQRQRRQKIIGYVLKIAAAVLIAFLIVRFVCFSYTIQGDSMMPTIENGEKHLVNRLIYHIKGPSRYDVIVFKLDDDASSSYYVKRVIGLPGETVQIKDGKIYVDGKAAKNYSDESISSPGVASEEITLGSDEYFVLGDNRNHSTDSREPNVGVLHREDLLGRDPIKVNMDEIFQSLKGKVILVTGGGGSIGSELCRQIADHEPKQLIIFDIYENNAYEIEQELKRKHPELNLKVLIGSVRDSRRINWVFEHYHPDIVYHAAAHKHVPLMETSPNEAIKNNVVGTYKTAYAALKHGTKCFVLISTDKAVNPTNIMGASKRLCEMVVQSMDAVSRMGRMDLLPFLHAHTDEDMEGQLSGDPMDHIAVERTGKDKNIIQIRSVKNKDRKGTRFVAVRFGNVLGSNGSVIPLFKKQIEAGGPVTVTHPDIIRYFMTIPEAVSLVLQAGTYARGGEIFVLDMGEPIKIDTLARNLIKLSGYKPDEDIKIVYVGLRPGEKLYEEKLMAEEGMLKTENKLIHIGKPIPFDTEKFLKQLEGLAKASYEEMEAYTRENEEYMVPMCEYAKKHLPQYTNQIEIMKYHILSISNIVEVVTRQNRLTSQGS